MSISRVQYKHVYPGTSGAFPSNTAAGNLIVVMVSGADAGPATSVSDGVNTYTKVLEVVNSRTRMAVYYAYNIAGGAVTITATIGNSDRGFTAVEYHSSNGAFSADPLDVYTSRGTAPSSPCTLSLTTTALGLLFCGWADETYAYFSGWTSNLSQVQKDASHFDATAEGLNKASGAYTEGYTHSTISSVGVLALLAFKEPAAAASVVPVLMAQYRQRRN